MPAILRQLTSPGVRWLAAAITLTLGLVFTFVWAPHPWGWRGIDQYHQLAVSLANGEPFGTTDVPWAYAYYVAAFYRMFGEQSWIPVVVQVFANATVPLLLYAIAIRVTDRRTAALASLLIGIFSFNTIYASTQASDALCTVTFLAALWMLSRAHDNGKLAWFATAGLVSGLMPQFRPNLILLPIVAALIIVALAAQRRRAVLASLVYLTCFAAVLTPWTMRNYRLTETFLPSSSHGGVQLWYGTLQTGEYLESRAHNPRSVFETPAFDYFSIAGPSLEFSAAPRGCAPATPSSVALAYRTDRDRTPRRVTGARRRDGRFDFVVPGQPIPTAVYYWFETSWPADAADSPRYTPPGGELTPFAFFVTDDHLGDQDRHDDLLDIFDLARALRDPQPGAGELRHIVKQLVPSVDVAALNKTPEHSTLRFTDGSSLTVPRTFARVTDLEIAGPAATALSYARVPRWQATALDRSATSCLELENIRVNDAFYRREPHMMRRYTALAFDNISRDPHAFATASLYRAIRLFVIRGTSDQMTTQQFESSARVYLAGTLLSGVYLTLFVAGVIVEFLRRGRALILILPILYVPVTICFVLTNMRYTITVQPLMFIFVAIALLALFPRADAVAPANAGRNA
jgi:hypothetical protein